MYCTRFVAMLSAKQLFQLFGGAAKPRKTLGFMAYPTFRFAAGA
jgi:hypothetical protein